MTTPTDYNPAFADAIRTFWTTKTRQQDAAEAAGTSEGTRGSVTAGRHMSGFEDLVRRVVSDAGVHVDRPKTSKLYIPGFYRETKAWDVILFYRGSALAIVEAKSQGSSLANNFNNRVEEAIGQAADVWRSYESGLLVSKLRPWVGYVMIVEETEATTTPKHLLRGKTVAEGMAVDPAFDGKSYAERYAMAFARLDQERMLDATCVAITSGPEQYEYPDPRLSFNAFAAQLAGRCKQVLAVVG